MPQELTRPFTDEDLKQLKEGFDWNMSGAAMVEKSAMRGLFDRLAAAENAMYAGRKIYDIQGNREFDAATKAWRQASGK